MLFIVSIFPSVYPSTHPSILLFIHPSIHLSVYLSILPSVCPSIYMYLLKSTDLSIYLPVNTSMTHIITYNYMVPCWVFVARNPREGRHCCLNCQQSQGWPPEPAIFVSVVAVEAMQIRGVPKVTPLTWMGHGFGLRRAQLLTLNPQPFHIYTLYTSNPKQPHHPQRGAGATTTPQGRGNGVKH